MTASTADYGGGNAADCISGPVEDNDFFIRITDEVYDQYKKGPSTADIDQLSAKLALAIPEQESFEAPCTPASESIHDTADQLSIVTAEHCYE